MSVVVVIAVIAVDISSGWSHVQQTTTTTTATEPTESWRNALHKTVPKSLPLRNRMQVSVFYLRTALWLQSRFLNERTNGRRMEGIIYVLMSEIYLSRVDD